MSTDILLDQPHFDQHQHQQQQYSSLEKEQQQQDHQQQNNNMIMDTDDIHKQFVEDNNVTSSSSDEESSNSSGEDISDSEINTNAAASGITPNATATSSSSSSATNNSSTSNNGRVSRSNSKTSSHNHHHHHHHHHNHHNKPTYINRSNTKCVRNPVTLVEEYSSSSLSSYTNSSSLSTENIFNIIKEIEDVVNSCNIIEFNNNNSNNNTTNTNTNNTTTNNNTSSSNLGNSNNNIESSIPADRPGRKLSISASSLPVVLIPGSTSIPPIALSASAPSLPQSVSTTTTTTTPTPTTTECNDITPKSPSTTSTTPSKKNRLFKFKKSNKSSTPSPALSPPSTSSSIPKSPSTTSINPSSSSCSSDEEEVTDQSATTTTTTATKKEKKKWRLSVKKKPKKTPPPIPLELEQQAPPAASKPQHDSLNQSHSNIKTSQSSTQIAPTNQPTTSTSSSSTTTTTTTTDNLFNSKNNVEIQPATNNLPSEELESNHEINSNSNNNESPSPSPSLLSASMPLASNGDNPLHFYLEPENNFKGNSFGGQGLLDMLAEEEEMPKGGRGRSNAFYLKGPPSIGANGEILPPPSLNPKPPSPRSTESLDSINNVLPKESSSLLSKPIGLLSKFKKSKNSQSSNVKSHSGLKVVKHHSSRFIVGFADTIGRRPNMEDESVIYGTFRGHIDEDYFALFDGHGGNDVAKLAATDLHKHLAEKLKANHNPVKSLKESFASLHRAIQDKNMRGGTTAVVALFLGKKGYVANVGDSRAVLCRDGVAVRVSNDHKPNDPKEEERIKALGGTVVTTVNAFTGVTTSRVNGQLAVSRALGDLLLVPYVSCEPDIFGPINLETHIKNQFMIIACDGIWDVMSDDEAISIVAPISDPEKACMKLREIAYSRRSTDNISVMVIKFPPFNLD
ncbi:protein phosphatase 2C-related protein [Heterostelium album PN500]|uniref:Protein phosphatase 2C-related protein n=1 Tax=Heterostelium pallidum (strain ATCC 26659 / Pp 5 / PN500) TaxID=670386 RepID=D3BL06_HETP5|nr:protein phosphatase 2C-related protein [Heterostelium album PN500]EFA78586.1 protein phosphatase 2C-related protein [Heterostelium album PN500]|eukprot:XP_020430710.1 protein phosphatase 2C-related protein [Heterostelium album PN500]